jgi:putative transcriptional regulator
VFGLGKPRSKFGKFLDKHDITQQDLSRKSEVSKATISRLCQGDAFTPSMKNGTKLIKALRNLTKKNIDFDDFWSM